MPQDKRSTGAGVPPAEGEALRPTVVKPPAAGARGGRKPAAEPASASAPASAPSLPAAPAPAVPSVARPTAIVGVRRERIPVTPRELRALSPEASDAACAAAAQLLASVVAETLNERKAVLWGHALQKAYGDQVTGTLALAQDPLVEQARSHVTRMMEILGAMDLMAVCGHDRRGLLGRVGKAMNGRIDTPGELARALDELRLLLDHMHAAIDRLLGQADRLRQHAGAMAQIEAEVEAAALAALFLSNHLAGRAPELAQRFTDRAMSLAATVVQARQGEAVRRIQIEQPLQLIGAIQNVALVTLPGFIAGLAALLTLTRTKGASPTEARDMSYRLRDILNQLTT